ncbi:hypothetical protein VTN77DRAFT_4977 [Rasamsonia byssochlamydoides]|uniref:uncharacterized protein n=1 Tax=Rasamsonia byssochlamydoides TaxID=89139 RepID=UPI0037446361
MLYKERERYCDQQTPWLSDLPSTETPKTLPSTSRTASSRSSTGRAPRRPRLATASTRSTCSPRPRCPWPRGGRGRRSESSQGGLQDVVQGAVRGAQEGRSRLCGCGGPAADGVPRPAHLGAGQADSSS